MGPATPRVTRPAHAPARALGPKSLRARATAINYIKTQAADRDAVARGRCCLLKLLALRALRQTLLQPKLQRLLRGSSPPHMTEQRKLIAGISIDRGKRGIGEKLEAKTHETGQAVGRRAVDQPAGGSGGNNVPQPHKFLSCYIPSAILAQIMGSATACSRAPTLPTLLWSTLLTAPFGHHWAAHSGAGGVSFLPGACAPPKLLYVRGSSSQCPATYPPGLLRAVCIRYLL